MSWKAVKAVLDHSTLKGGPLLLLIVIADCMPKDTYTVNYSMMHYAKRARMTHGRAFKYLRAVRESGELLIETHKGRKSLYTLKLPIDDDTSPESWTPIAVSSAQTRPGNWTPPVQETGHHPSRKLDTTRPGNWTQTEYLTESKSNKDRENGHNHVSQPEVQQTWRPDSLNDMERWERERRLNNLDKGSVRWTRYREWLSSQNGHHTP